MKKPKGTTCSHAEFEALPQSLQRKYFSELERLRIQDQHQAALDALARDESRQTAPSSRRASRASTTAIRRSLSRRRLPRKKSSLRPADPSPAAAAAAPAAPHNDQSVFLLPEKAARLLLGGEDLPSPPVPLPLPAHHNPLRDFRFGFDDPDPSTLHPLRGRPPSRTRPSSIASSSISPTRRPTSRTVQQHHDHDYDYDYDHDTDLDLDLDLDLELNPSLRTMSPLAGRQPSRASFRRTLSLTTIPLRTSTSSTPMLPDSPPPLSARCAAPWHHRAHSQSLSLSGGLRSSHAPAAPVFDPEATHYRDPEARRKLRMFLASPQKFDEAVEFGFPSTSGSDSVGMGAAQEPHYQLPPIRTDARGFSKDMQTFLKDDRVSFFSELGEEVEDEHDEHDHDAENKGLESEDSGSVADMDSPLTPSSVGLSFRSQGHNQTHMPHARKQSSTLSSVDISHTGGTMQPLTHPLTGRLNREMTLRMTLTRPDLRADEDQLYGWQTPSQSQGPLSSAAAAKTEQQQMPGMKEDPFALEDLALTDDMDGSRGPFYIKPKTHVQGNLVSRLFRKGGRGKR